MMKFFIFFLTLNLLFFSLIKNSHSAQNINISGYNKESLPLELKIGEVQNAKMLNLVHMLYSRIKTQLNDSKIFDSFLEEENNSIYKKITKKNYKYIPFSVTISQNSNNILTIEIYDNILKKIVGKFNENIKEKKWYRTASSISDQIFYHLTSVYGYFDTSILFISEKGKYQNREKKIAIMSLYGDEYAEYTNGRNLVLSPSLSNDKKNIAYVSYQDLIPKAYIYNLKKKKVKPIIKSDIMSFTPNFVRENNNQILLSASYDGNSEVVLYDIKTKKTKKLTNHIATDISADYSVSQNKIVFSSDRSGKAELYLMDKDGKNIKKIKFNKGTYTNPKYSPDGRYIAYTRILDNKFNIGVLDTNNFNNKILTESYKDDSPNWAPNSKYIIFTRKSPKKFLSNKGISNLFIVDLNGNIVKKINTPFDASEAFWFKN